MIILSMFKINPLVPSEEGGDDGDDDGGDDGSDGGDDDAGDDAGHETGDGDDGEYATQN